MRISRGRAQALGPGAGARIQAEALPLAGGVGIGKTVWNRTANTYHHLKMFSFSYIAIPLLGIHGKNATNSDAPNFPCSLGVGTQYTCLW